MLGHEEHSWNIGAELRGKYLEIFGLAGEQGLQVVEVLQFLADLLLLGVKILGLLLFDFFSVEGVIDAKTHGDKGDES